MSEFDLWCNLKYLSLEKLLTVQPTGWLEVIPYHADAKKIVVYCDEGKYWLQLQSERVCETNYWTARKVLKALRRAAQKKVEEFDSEIREIESYSA